ncbi:unnamed protein product [Cutaneotrichosporon oleaginosum]
MALLGPDDCIRPTYALPLCPVPWSCRAQNGLLYTMRLAVCAARQAHVSLAALGRHTSTISLSSPCHQRADRTNSDPHAAGRAHRTSASCGVRCLQTSLGSRLAWDMSDRTLSWPLGRSHTLYTDPHPSRSALLHQCETRTVRGAPLFQPRGSASTHGATSGDTGMHLLAKAGSLPISSCWWNEAITEVNSRQRGQIEAQAWPRRQL